MVFGLLFGDSVNKLFRLTSIKPPLFKYRINKIQICMADWQKNISN